MTFVSVLHFFTRVNSNCSWVRAEKDSELSKTSKMKLLEKTVKIFIKALPIFAFILDVGV